MLKKSIAVRVDTSVPKRKFEVDAIPAVEHFCPIRRWLRSDDREREKLEAQFRNENDLEEPYSWYEKGMLHPVEIGHRLNNGQYTIFHKLGTGSGSTVWLAHDSSTNKNVAVKIRMADMFGGKPGVPRELSVAKVLRHNAEDDSGGSVLDPSTSIFRLRGPNGWHNCLDSSPMRVSLSESKRLGDGLWHFPTKVARAVAAQLVLGVAYMHSRKVVHGGMYLTRHHPKAHSWQRDRESARER